MIGGYMKTHKTRVIIGSLALSILVIGGLVLITKQLRNNETLQNQASIIIKKGSLTPAKLKHDDQLMAMAVFVYGKQRVNHPEYQALSFDNRLQVIKSQPSEELALYHIATDKPGQPYFAVTGANHDTIKYYASTGEDVATVKVNHLVGYLNTNYTDRKLKQFTNQVHVEDDIATRHSQSSK